MSQRALSGLLANRGILLDASAIARIELGQRIIRLGEAAHIADILDFPIQTGVQSEALAVASSRLRRMSKQLAELADSL